jgi:hypothetical protein
MPFNMTLDLSFDPRTDMPIEDNSEALDMSKYDPLGLFPNYELRRSKFEWLANLGSNELRSDWLHYVGPLAADRFGVCNPLSGHAMALILPFCKPDRIKIISYLVESKFTP